MISATATISSAKNDPWFDKASVQWHKINRGKARATMTQKK